MQYISTRGGAAVDFKTALLHGLAPDGGLYVPDAVPTFSTREISALAGLSYTELALAVMAPFIGDSFARDDLKRMIDAAYSSFRHAAIAPLTQLSHEHFVLELFHGPTLAFKDFALQLLGHLLEAALADKGERAVILGATSGDTGSAAIAGCMGRKNLDIVILYPHGRTSDVQRRQMTTLGQKNIHALAVDGTFDDCQDMVKALFSDAEFRKSRHLLAVNSINFARVLAQVVYYFYAALNLGAPARRVNFSVPTGNFGDIYAGYIARAMGLPMGKLIIATNKNDILARCVATGTYQMNGVRPSLSPSMDIEISSNFERLLFDLHDRDGARMAQRMAEFRSSKSLTLSASQHADLKAIFAAHATDDAATIACIKQTYAECGVLLDPHTATGVAATEALRNSLSPCGRGLGRGGQPLAKSGGEPPPPNLPPQGGEGLSGVTVTLATAHPAKFPEAVKEATGVNPTLPPHLADLFTRTEKITPLARDGEALKSYITKL